MDSKEILQNGEIEIEGLIPDSSNGALKVKTFWKEHEIDALIKPNVSVRALWDFPDRDLNNREYATFLFDRELGLNLVPETALRNIKGISQCLVQEWIHEAKNDLVIVKSPEEIPSHYKTVLQGYDELNKLITLAHKNTVEIRNLCLFDLIINNADRKGGHLLLDDSNKMWAIDHGVTWHEESKIRTVLWGWIGEKLNKADLEFLSKAEKVLTKWSASEFEYLKKEEIDAALTRVRSLLNGGIFPQPGDQWPAVPWPIF